MANSIEITKIKFKIKANYYRDDRGSVLLPPELGWKMDDAWPIVTVLDGNGN